jgi:hypothetical protein
MPGATRERESDRVTTLGNFDQFVIPESAQHLSGIQMLRINKALDSRFRGNDMT